MLSGACTSKKFHNKPLKQPNNKTYNIWNDWPQPKYQTPKKQMENKLDSHYNSNGKVSKECHFHFKRHHISTNIKSHQLCWTSIKMGCNCILPCPLSSNFCCKELYWGSSNHLQVHHPFCQENVIFYDRWSFSDRLLNILK